MDKFWIRCSALLFSRPFVFELFCLKVKVKVTVLKLKLKFIFTPKYFQVLRQKNSKSFYLENIKVWPQDNFSTYWLHWCVCVWLYKIQICRMALFFSRAFDLNFFRLKNKIKVDLLKLTLKLVFPYNYFQILRQKMSKSFYMENIKVRPRDDYME